MKNLQLPGFNAIGVVFLFAPIRVSARHDGSANG